MQGFAHDVRMLLKTSLALRCRLRGRARLACQRTRLSMRGSPIPRASACRPTQGQGARRGTWVRHHEQEPCSSRSGTPTTFGCRTAKLSCPSRRSSLLSHSMYTEFLACTVCRLCRAKPGTSGCRWSRGLASPLGWCPSQGLQVDRATNQAHSFSPLGAAASNVSEDSQRERDTASVKCRRTHGRGHGQRHGTWDGPHRHGRRPVQSEHTRQKWPCTSDRASGPPPASQACYET